MSWYLNVNNLSSILYTFYFLLQVSATLRAALGPSEENIRWEDIREHVSCRSVAKRDHGGNSTTACWILYLIYRLLRNYRKNISSVLSTNVFPYFCFDRKNFKMTLLGCTRVVENFRMKILWMYLHKWCCNLNHV